MSEPTESATTTTTHSVNVGPITDQHYGYNIIRTGFYVAAGLGALYMSLQFMGSQISDTIPAMVITGLLGFLAGRKS